MAGSRSNRKRQRRRAAHCADAARKAQEAAACRAEEEAIAAELEVGEQTQRAKEEVAEEQASIVTGSDSVDCQEEMDEVQTYDCGICFGDQFPTDELVEKPCQCAVSYCKQCWNHSMVNAAPRCPSCRAGIGFDYDSEKGEAKFLLFDNEKPAPDGMIPFPWGYRAGTAFERVSRRHLDKEISRRARPAFLKMLSNEEAAPPGGARTCVCGGKNCFRRMTIEERRDTLRKEGRDPVRVMSLNLFCDHCEKELYNPDWDGDCLTAEEGKTRRNATHVWSCERGTAVVHMFGLDVCEECMGQSSSSQ